MLSRFRTSATASAVSGVQCLAPNNAEYRDVNDFSVVLKLTYGDVSFLLTGDATTVSEREMLQSFGNKLPSTVLKAGHHGSNTSTTAAFFNVVRPQVIVFMVGEGNSFGHPTQAVFDRVAGTDIYRTDKQGTIIFVTDGKQVAVYSPPVNGQYQALPSHKTSNPLVARTPTSPPWANQSVGGSNVVRTSTTPARPPQVTVPVQPQGVASGMVYITNTGKMYHRDGCRSLSQSKIEVSRATAIQRGLTACSVCNP